MDGKVGCQSELGHGALFWFTLKVELGSGESEKIERLSATVKKQHFSRKEIQIAPVLTRQQSEQIAAYIESLDALLAEHLFDSLGCFKEMKAQFENIGLNRQLSRLENLISNMQFEQAREYLDNMEKSLTLDEPKNDE